MAPKVVDKYAASQKTSPFARTFIKQWREYRHLTQEQLAELVSKFLHRRGIKKGYTHASIGRLENGKIGYTQLILEALADSLGTDPPSLLIRDPNDAEGIWTLWEKAVPEQRATITEHAEIVIRHRPAPAKP
jgi:transcriptional regulator with XRE-family HTH domain